MADLFNSKKRFMYAGALICLFAITTIAAFFSANDTVSNRFVAKNISTLLTETNWNPPDGKNITPEEVVEKNPQITNNGSMDVYTYLLVTVPYYTKYVDLEDKDGKLVLDAGDNNVLSTSAIPLFKFITSDMSDDNNYAALNDEATNLTQQVNSPWTPVTGYPKVQAFTDSKGKELNAGVIVYAYAYTESAGSSALKALPVDQITPSLFDKVKLINIRENDLYSLGSVFAENPLGVQVTSKCIQTGVGSTDKDVVWKLLEDE